MSYSVSFLEPFNINVPEVNSLHQDVFINNGYNAKEYFLDYNNYSLLQNPVRKFPFYTAANIDGNLYKDGIQRKDNWKKDKRIPKEHQWGHELYKAENSNFDKGHITKRQDVQWGNTELEASDAAESTFVFTNAMPQVDRLNRGVWKKIEDYILHQEVVKKKFKITLFSGPVFLKDDPVFSTLVKGESIKLPYLFWKVIYYIKDDQLFRTGFLTSQIGLLRRRRIVKPIMRDDHDIEEPFQTFRDAETYQVDVDFIEKISCLEFQKASEVFRDHKPEKLIIKGVDVRGDDSNLENVQMNVIL
jgi:endonuclease G